VSQLESLVLCACSLLVVGYSLTTMAIKALTCILLVALLPFVLCASDFYDVLGVSRDATESQIKKAYRQLSLKYHPDKDPSEEAKQKFVELANAYEVLGDEEKRRIYDQYGEDGLKHNGQQNFHNPFDIFSAFSGFRTNTGSSQMQQNKGPDLEIELEVTLKDLYLGRVIDVAHRKQSLCHKCRGTGAKKASDVTTCSGCKGTGMKMKVQQLGPGFVQQTQTVCDECGGKGKKVTSTCPHCGGKKVEVGEDNLMVSIERGMMDGEKIVFSQQADEAPDTTPGDLVFRVVTAPHKRFVRSGDDLHFSLTVSLLEALVGFTKKIKHLDGHTVEIVRTEVTKPGQVLTIKGEGMPQHNYPSNTGDLHVEVTVKFPTSITEEQKEGFKNLLQS